MQRLIAETGVLRLFGLHVGNQLSVVATGHVNRVQAKARIKRGFITASSAGFM